MTTSLLTITYDEAKADLLELADERPDFVYEPPSGVCRYFADDGSPSCIVGYVFAKHGIQPDQLVKQSTQRNLNENAAVGLLRDEGLITCDDATATLLAYAQDEQDNGHSWGPAVIYAIDAAEENL